MCDLKKHIDEHPLPHGFFKSRRRRLPEQGGRHHTLPEALTPERDAFNYVHSHRRLCIDRAFARLLYARFTVLRDGLNKELVNVYATITACCVIHNIIYIININICKDPGNTSAQAGEGWSGLVQYWLQCTAMYTVQRRHYDYDY